MNKVIRWFAVGREDLLDVLLNEELPSSEFFSAPSLSDLRSGKLALGYEVDDGDPMWSTLGPTVIILDDDSATETMSWLRVFAEEAFPLSQFARVVKYSDWITFSSNEKNSSCYRNFVPQRWASVSVGEVLAQSESDVDLQNMPLSRIAGSLTLPAGRSAQIFGSDNATKQCVDRLRILSGDARFSRRPITVSQLTPIWALCDMQVEGHLEAYEAAILVAEAASKFLRVQDSLGSKGGRYFLDSYDGLQSDSAEERVIAFNEFCEDVLSSTASESAASAAYLLAAAVFMVGRSTSHAFLLNRFRKVVPAAFAWFGLIAAFAGSRYWDTAWLRAVKGAERLLKPRFEWTDTSSADIGWAEFSWLADSLDDVSQIMELPKMLPRTLGVEVVPGVAMQIRFGQSSVGDEKQSVSLISAKERSLTDALNQILEVALKVQGRKFENDTPTRARFASKSPQSQQPLNLEPPSGGNTKKTPRSKKGKRDLENT